MLVTPKKGKTPPLSGSFEGWGPSGLGGEWGVFRFDSWKSSPWRQRSLFTTLCSSRAHSLPESVYSSNHRLCKENFSWRKSRRRSWRSDVGNVDSMTWAFRDFLWFFRVSFVADDFVNRWACESFNISVMKVYVYEIFEWTDFHW